MRCKIAFTLLTSLAVLSSVNAVPTDQANDTLEIRSNIGLHIIRDKTNGTPGYSVEMLKKSGGAVISGTDYQWAGPVRVVAPEFRNSAPELEAAEASRITPTTIQCLYRRRRD